MSMLVKCVHKSGGECTIEVVTDVGPMCDAHALSGELTGSDGVRVACAHYKLSACRTRSGVSSTTVGGPAVVVDKCHCCSCVIELIEVFV